MTTNNFKGISPVIATILMVMITVGLVAFSYSWFMGIGTTSQDKTGKQLSNMDKSGQSFNIPIAYESATPDRINFEFKASSLNSLGLSANTSIKAYLNEVPVIINNWDGGLGGISCANTSSKLTPGESCYGYVTATAGTCNSGDTIAFKVIHEWGAKQTISVICK